MYQNLIPDQSQQKRRSGTLDTGNSAEPLENSESDSLLDSLLTPQVRFVLIKGDPGTGKTTLALELLSRHGRGVYASTRVSLDQLSLQNPILRSLIERGFVSELRNSSYDKFKIEDYRLGSAQNIIGAFIDNSPDRSKLSPRLFVLDSWDSFATMLDPIDRQRTEISLLAIAEANNAKIVFVSENTELSRSDYMVDAIVNLEDCLHEGRRLRRMVWKKLRGTEIPNVSSLYTLDGGRFTILSRGSRVLFPHEHVARPFKSREDPPGHYSTGSEDLDAFFGGPGLKKGSTIAIELDQAIAAHSHIPIAVSIEFNFLSHNNAVVIIPPAERLPEMVKESIMGYYSEEALHRNLRLIHFMVHEKDPCFVHVDSKLEDARDVAHKAIDDLKGPENRPCFYFIEIEMAELMFRKGSAKSSGIEVKNHIFGKDNTKPMAIEFAQHLKSSKDLGLMITRSGTTLSKDLLSASDIYMKIQEVDGTLLIHSVKPASRLYQLHYDYSRGYPKVELKPIV